LLTRSGDSSPDSPVRELVRRRDTGEHQWVPERADHRFL
jgi:hypothetical protein